MRRFLFALALAVLGTPAVAAPPLTPDDDWYQRRRKDKEGEFFRALAEASGKRSHTLQGIYLFVADGTPLNYKNSGQSAEFTRDMMREALAKFAKLPESQRKPGAVKV